MKNLTKSQINYLKAIADLKHDVTVTKLADYLNYSKPSVVRGLKKLTEKGLITYAKPIVLTEKGKHYVHNIMQTDRILYSFFVNILAIESQQAKRDVTNIRHSVSCQTLQSLSNFLQANISDEDLIYCQDDCQKCQF